MTDDDTALFEQVLAAWRPRGPDGGVQSHPAWHDLGERDRERAARIAAGQRRIEAALDPEGLSTTGHAVLARIRAAAG